ncbi:hypothetical protein JXB31_04870 [Candidatus Woesearchaeota archaeon]|nr:hypothetical protein [Candidatus Woesearchaeota archaeon]
MPEYLRVKKGQDRRDILAKATEAAKTTETAGAAEKIETINANQAVGHGYVQGTETLHPMYKKTPLASYISGSDVELVFKSAAQVRDFYKRLEEMIGLSGVGSGIGSGIESGISSGIESEIVSGIGSEIISGIGLSGHSCRPCDKAHNKAHYDNSIDGVVYIKHSFFDWIHKMIVKENPGRRDVIEASQDYTGNNLCYTTG